MKSTGPSTELPVAKKTTKVPILWIAATDCTLSRPGYDVRLSERRGWMKIIANIISLNASHGAIRKTALC